MVKPIAKNNTKIGRPTLYNLKLAEDICDAISCTSKGLRRLCNEHEHWPDRVNVYRWIKKYPEFCNMYNKAKQLQIESFIDEVLEISDDTSNDTIIKRDNDGNEKEVCNSEYINRSRLRVDTRKWLAAKLCPRLYGERKEEKSTNESLLEKLIDKLANNG